MSDSPAAVRLAGLAGAGRRRQAGRWGDRRIGTGPCGVGERRWLALPDWNPARAAARLWDSQAEADDPRPGPRGAREAVGGSVTRFRVGDEVFGTPGDELRNIIGTFAEYVVAPETRIVPKPANLTFEQAAAAQQAGVTAFQALRKGNVQPGMTVLIKGAGGGVGTFAVQIAKERSVRRSQVCAAATVSSSSPRSAPTASSTKPARTSPTPVIATT
jgi:hypothetical protein